MKLFDTMPPFERLRESLTFHSLWLDLSPTRQRYVLEATKACCDRDRPPAAVVICRDSYVPAVAWHWRNRSVPWGLLTQCNLNEWHFTTYRKLIHGPGRIGESFVEVGPFDGGALDRFFGKMDRLKKEEEEACAS